MKIIVTFNQDDHTIRVVGFIGNSTKPEEMEIIKLLKQLGTIQLQGEQFGKEYCAAELSDTVLFKKS